MRKLLNTLYATKPQYYLAIQGHNILIKEEASIIGRYPLHILEAVICFSYLGMSPKLMEACMERGIAVSFLDPKGRFQARLVGKSNGNVLLRKEQIKRSMDEEASLKIARNMIVAKIANERWQLMRYKRQYPMRLEAEKLAVAIEHLAKSIDNARTAQNLDRLRGIEGDAQASYFSVFNEMILNQKEYFYFKGRSRRPPLDPVNALLSFGYTLLAHDCASALEANGLDAYIGFSHVERPGRLSLALDLLEELRGPVVDRFTLSLINRKQVSIEDFIEQENGAFLLKEESRNEYVKLWQTQKHENLTHPFLEEKIPWGLVPHAQAMLLARHIRGDLDEYPPFFWK